VAQNVIALEMTRVFCRFRRQLSALHVDKTLLELEGLDVVVIGVVVVVGVVVVLELVVVVGVVVGVVVAAATKQEQAELTRLGS